MLTTEFTAHCLIDCVKRTEGKLPSRTYSQITTIMSSKHSSNPNPDHQLLLNSEGHDGLIRQLLKHQPNANPQIELADKNEKMWIQEHVLLGTVSE